MKQYIYQMIILAVSTCLWSCQDDDPTPTVVEEPDWKLELVENDPEPEWEMPESGIYQFSMTGIMKLSDFLEGYADETDEVSAFIGNECRGVVKAQEYNGEKLFFLYIRGNSAEKQKVTLKYYSAKNKKLYVCNELFDFVQNGTYGKISDPAIPPFEESGKYPGNDRYCGPDRVTAFRTARQRYSGCLCRRRMPGCRDFGRNGWT